MKRGSAFEKVIPRSNLQTPDTALGRALPAVVLRRDSDLHFRFRRLQEMVNP